MLFSILGAASMAVTASGLVIASIWINFQLWDVYKLDFPLVLLLLLIVLVTGTNMIYGFLAESQPRKIIKGMFDQYVPRATSTPCWPTRITIASRGRVKS